MEEPILGDKGKNSVLMETTFFVLNSAKGGYYTNVWGLDSKYRLKMFSSTHMATSD